MVRKIWRARIGKIVSISTVESRDRYIAATPRQRPARIADQRTGPDQEGRADVLVPVPCARRDRIAPRSDHVGERGLARSACTADRDEARSEERRVGGR